MGADARKERTNRARRRQVEKFQAEHGCSYTEALRRMPRRRVPHSVKIRHRGLLTTFMSRAVRCADPGCSAPLRVRRDGSPQPIGKLSHIRFLGTPGGLDTLENLIVFCPGCHERIDSLTEDRPFEMLQAWARLQLAELHGSVEA